MTQCEKVPKWKSLHPWRFARRLGTIAVAMAAVALSGCNIAGPTQPAGWTNFLDPMERSLPTDPENVNYVLARMEYGRQAIRAGCYLRAKPKLTEAFKQLPTEHENVAAAISSERLKYYKGETYERAMLCCYLGLTEYVTGNYEDARRLFMRALSEDQAAVVKKTTPTDYGQDFGLACYWLGKTYQKLGKSGNTAAAFKRAKFVPQRKKAAKELEKDQNDARKFIERRAEGERWAYQTFHNPESQQFFIAAAVNLAEVNDDLDSAPKELPATAAQDPILRRAADKAEFFHPEYQQAANLILMIELGCCPPKILAGMHNERTEIIKPLIRPHHVQVYVDGHPAGQAYQLLDLWHQADTQDRILKKDAAQTGKAILKEVLSHTPYVGSVVGYWDVSGDSRHWRSLPGKVYVYASKVAPGAHDIRIRMFDANGKLLPRWTNTYYGLAVPASGEACILLNPCCGGDNRLSASQRAMALKAGARPGSRSTNPYMRR